MAMKSSSVSALGPFGRILGRIWGGFWVVLGLRGAPFGRSEANLDTCTSKRGGGYFSPSPFGQEKWAGELARRYPEDPKIGRSSPEERAKRLCGEKIVKTSKTSTLWSEMRGFGGREGSKILKNRPRSGLEGLKSSIVT